MNLSLKKGKLLGKGAFGEVRSCQSKLDKTNYAIKLIE